MATSKNLDNPTALDAMSAVANYVISKIAGIRVGTVVVPYPDGTADVQPVRLRKLFGAPQPQQLVSKAPVGWWRFGGMTLVGELEPGDQVLIVNLQRDFSAWWASGLVALAPTERMHDPADVIILPWLQSLLPTPDLHGGPAIRVPGTFRMGRVDSTAGITMWPAKTAVPPLSLTVEIDGGPAGIKAGKTATSFALKGTEIAATATTIASTLTAVPVSASPDPATITAVAGNKTAILNLITAITSNLTVKLVVE